MLFGSFTVEEINIISMYQGQTRTETIAKIDAVLPFMDGDMRPIAEGAVRKLTKMEEREYAETSFVPAYETEEGEGNAETVQESAD